MTGLSGAATYNFAVGGGSATYHGENDCDFPNVIQRFLKENLSDTAGGKVFAPGGNTIDDLDNKKMCIVINFGLNDYFTGSLIENPADPDDTASYKGGLRACIARLRENFPHAAYIVMSPTHTGFFSNGRDIQSPQGGPLSAYVDAAEAAALETGAYFLDNYNDFVITDENLWDYLGDGCHPNENGHLAIAAQLPLNVVSLAGGVNCYLPNTNSNVFNARLYLIPSPLLLSSAAVRDSLRQEPDVEEIFRMIPLSSMSVVGIGCLSDRATIVKNGILNNNDFTFLKMQGAVGDVLSHFLDKNGQVVSHDLEGRLMSTPMDQLRTLENVIGAAGGPDKAEAILAVLRGGYLDVLITDEDTAQLLLEAEP